MKDDMKDWPLGTGWIQELRQRSKRKKDGSLGPEYAPGAHREKHGIRLRRFAGSDIYADKLERPIRVAHLTDQHVGLVTPMKVQMAAIDIVKREEPDLVVLTGDFVCHSQAFLEDLKEVVDALGLPTFAVLGNHDYWSGAQGVTKALIRGGVEVLSNAHTSIEIKGQRLQLVGLDDAYTGHADRRKALKGINTKIPTLGLSHIAEEADGLWANHVPLVLSGHTHGGQLTVARLHELTLGFFARHRYIHGMYGERGPEAPPKGAVYVSAGIGASVMPLRLGDRGNREVTIFELGIRPDAMKEHHEGQEAFHPPPEQSESLLRAKAKARFQARQRRKKQNKRR